VFVWGNDDPAGISIHLGKFDIRDINHQAKHQQINKQIGMNDNFGMLTNQKHIEQYRTSQWSHLRSTYLAKDTQFGFVWRDSQYLLRLCLEHT